MILLAIITLGTVSAEDIDENLTVNDFSEDSVVESVSDDDLGASGGDVALSAQLKDEDIDIDAPNKAKACQNNEIYVTLPGDATGVVTSYVDGYEDCEKDLEDGYADIPLKFDSFGLHDVKLMYSGDSKYSEKLIWSHMYNVTDFVMDVTYPDDIYYGQESTIYVHLPDEVNGDLSLNLNDNFYSTVSSFNGDWEFDVYNLKLGENQFTVKYYGGNYHDVTVKGTFMAIPVIDIPYTAYYNREYNVTLILPSDAKGSLFVNFNETLYSSKMKNGKASVSLPTNMDLGYYLITAYYSGSDYDVEDAYYAFELAPNVKFSKYMWIEGNNNIIFEGPSSMKGTLKVEIDENAAKKVKITNGKATIPLTGLDVGEHNFYLTYEEEDYSFSDYESFEVRDVNPNIDLTLDFIAETRVNEPFDISTNIPDDGDGILYVYVDGELASNYVSWGFANYASIDSANLGLGKHTVKLEYCGDSYYKNVSKTAKFSVVDVKIIIPEQIGYDQNNWIDVFIAKNVTGNITVYVDGKKYKMVPITPAYYGNDEYGYLYSFYLNNIDMGLHKIKVAYSGDNLHTAKTKSVDVNVSYNIVIYDEDFIYGNGKLYIELPHDATNNITAKIDGKNFKKIVYQNKGLYREIYLDISDIKGGTHTVEVTYPGDERYYPLTVSGKFNVSYQIEIANNEAYGQGITYVSLMLPKNANGHLRACLDDGDWIDSAFTNGLANITFGYLPIGEHRIIAVYTGEDYHCNPDGGEYIFDIEPYFCYEEPEINEPGYVYLELPSAAKGNLVVYVDGALYKKSKLTKGKANITIDLRNDDGGHYLKVVYDGNDYIFSESLNWYVPFSSQDTPLFKGDNMSIELPSDFIGKAKIQINDMTYTPKLVNGYATFTPENLKIGENYLFFNYYGGNYENYGDEWNFTVLPKVSISNEKVYLGPYRGPIMYYKANASTSDYMVIDLEDSFNGEYTVVIDENYYTKGSFVKGVANISLSKAKPGIQEIYVDYEYQKGKHDMVYFYADIKQAPNISVSAKNIYAGQKLEIAVKAPSDATGKAILNANNRNYTLTLVNGKATKSISNLPVGNYPISVRYAGDEKYGGNVAATTARVLSKVTPDLSLSVSNINVGKAAIIKVAANAEINGNVIVNVNNVDHDVKLVNGQGNLSVSGLKYGSYKANAKFGGNTKFLPQNATKAFTVTYVPTITGKASALYSAKYSVTVHGTNGKVAKNVTVVFKINGKKITTAKTNSNGVATFSIPTKYAPKKYTISATALGKTLSKKVTVKHVPTLKTVTVKKSAKKLVLTATLKKVNGKYLKKKTVTFKFNGKKYTAKTNSKGVAKVTIKKAVLKKLKAGKKVTYQATYLKDTVKKTAKVKK
ncbi:hypothetical protein [Methanobrevibacter sp.]|uniref:hypothetical protein n=1 Tax=Methanobrevibacter sp. TaxID=66852 RepID=UPI00386A4685